MNELDMQQRLRSAVEHAVPDVLDDILSDCDDGKGKIIEMNNTQKRNPRLLRTICSIAAALALVIAGTFAYTDYQAANAAYSVISFDVNPSVELDVSKSEKVVGARALNSDGEKILEGLELRGVELDTAVRALVGSMLEHGFLSDIYNSILITVDGEDNAKSSELESRLMTSVADILSESNVDGAILGQTGSGNETVKKLAGELGISDGRAALIQSLLDANPAYSPEELSKLNINELNILLNGQNAKPEGLDSVGSASVDAYIGTDSAFKSAYWHAGVSEDGTYAYEAELDFEDGKMVYELEFTNNGVEYDYEVDALTGEILKWFTERSDHPVIGSSDGTGGNDDRYDEFRDDIGDLVQSAIEIGLEDARNAALNHAGVSGESARDFNVELDDDGASARYEVEFKSGNTEYEYYVDAATGAITNWFSEIDNDFDYDDYFDDNDDDDNDD